MNDFNLKLQGKDVLICDVYTLVKAFRQKLILFETQISKNCFIHFSTCDKYNKESKTQFPVDFAQKIISELKIQFKLRFSDLDVKSEEINIFQNPFSCDIEKLPPTLQMEMIDLQSNDALKIKHREKTLVDFYKFLPDIQYPNLKKIAIEYISWLNEEIPLDNNEITDEEFSDDEDNITKGKDLFSVVDNNPSEENIVTNELEIENEDSFEFILDNTDINFSNIIEPVEPVVIAVPTSTQTVNLHDISGPSNNIKSSSSKKLKTLQKKKKEDTSQIRRKWKKITVKTLDPDYSLPDGPVDGKFMGETATSIFLEFIDGFIDQLVYQTNLYSIQRGRPLNIKRFEILNFIGINFLMGYNKLPSWKHYWATSDDLNVPCVSNTMSRNRFDNILSNLHVQDNLLIPKNNKDKLFKLRPLINYCNETFFTSYHGTRELSIDESMIIFKGRNCMKQYNPQKPIKRGYKIWCLSNQRGYIKNCGIMI
ncbi:hypothetical protein QTP88_011683 [Uroleucon formosanum]